MRCVLAAGSGLLLSLAFPGWLAPGLAPWTGWLAWIALVPFLVAVEGARPRTGAALGWLAGAVFFASALYWILVIRELAYARVPAWLALAAVFGLYWAVWGWAVARMGGAALAWAAAPAWWMLEALRGWLGTGFPWLPLGASQWAAPHLFLAARSIGTAGIGLAVVAVNVAVWAWGRGRPGRRAALGLAAGWLATLLVLSASAARSIRLAADPASAIRVAALQGSFTEEDKWSLPVATMVARYEALAADAARRGAVLMVWPETATASEIEMPGMVPRLAAVAARTHAVQVVGALSRNAAGRYANGAFVVTRAGLAGGYRKMHLVPFGEYMPAWARAVLPFVRKLTEGMDDLVPGADPEPLAVPGMPGVRLGVFVCYEAVFPGTGRDRVARCATLFVNVTNDAWYHDSAATSQHALGPVARAVEGGRWIIRSANTGLSFIAGPDGRMVTGPGLSQPGIVVADVVPPADGCLRTGFTRWGGVPLAVYAVAAFAAAWRRRSRPA